MSFVATKMILVAAAANERPGPTQQVITADRSAMAAAGKINHSLNAPPRRVSTSRPQPLALVFMASSKIVTTKPHVSTEIKLTAACLPETGASFAEFSRLSLISSHNARAATVHIIFSYIRGPRAAIR